MWIRVLGKNLQMVRLTPEEYKINYRSKVVRNHQRRVMDHIFGGRPFKLAELSELCRWMKGPEEEDAFMNSCLVPGPDGQDVPLSHSTIGTYACSMLNMLEWVKITFSDQDVMDATTKAMAAMHGCDKTALKKARITSARRRYLDKEYYLVPIGEIQKLIESDALMRIIQRAIRIATIKDKEECIDYIKNYTQESVYALQCHIAVLLTLHTGKRPGILCGIKLNAIFSAQCFNIQSRKDTDETTYIIQVVPSYEYALFKTVQVTHIVITETFLILLEALSVVRQVINKSQLEARLLTHLDFPLCDIWDLLQKAWGDAGCEGQWQNAGRT